MSQLKTSHGSGVEICVSWIPCRGTDVPHNAIKAGGDVYVARAKHNGVYVPAKKHRGHEGAYVPYGGKEIMVPEFEVLVDSCIPNGPGGHSFEWKHASGGSVPNGAIVAGVDGHEPLYVGRCNHDGNITCGKVHGSHGTLYIPYGGSEHSHKEYEVLCCTKRKA